MNKLDIFSRLLEGTMITTRDGKTTYVANDVDSNTVRQDQNVKSAATTRGQKLKETELEEMARIASRYKLSDDWKEAFEELSDVAKKNKTVQFIINFAKNHETWQILDIAKAYGEMKGDPRFARQQMFNPIVKDILEPKGIIEAVSGEALTKPRGSFAGEEGSVERDLADRDAASDRELSQYFNVAKGKDKEEFEDEPDEIEPDLPAPTDDYHKPSSVATKAAEFLYDNDRLLQKMINVLMDSRTKLRKGLNEDDIKGDNFYQQEKNRKETSKSKLDILVDEYVVKIKEQEPAVQQKIMDMLEDKLATMMNLYNKISKTLGTIQKPEVSNKEDEFDDLNIDDLEFDDEDVPLDEWFIHKLQHRASLS